MEINYHNFHENSFMFKSYLKLLAITTITVSTSVIAKQLELPSKPEFTPTPNVCSAGNNDDAALCTFIKNMASSRIEEAALLNYANEVNSISGLKSFSVDNVKMYEIGIQTALDCYRQVYKGDIERFNRIAHFVRRNVASTGQEKISHSRYASILAPITIMYAAPNQVQCAAMIKNNLRSYK